MTWKCDNCGNVNPNRVNSCLKCGAMDENFELTYGHHNIPDTSTDGEY